MNRLDDMELKGSWALELLRRGHRSPKDFIFLTYSADGEDGICFGHGGWGAAWAEGRKKMPSWLIDTQPFAALACLATLAAGESEFCCDQLEKFLTWIWNEAVKLGERGEEGAFCVSIAEGSAELEDDGEREGRSTLSLDTPAGRLVAALWTEPFVCRLQLQKMFEILVRQGREEGQRRNVG